MPKNKKARSTVKDLMIIAIFIFSLSAFTLSISAYQKVNNNLSGYSFFHLPKLHVHAKRKTNSQPHHNIEKPHTFHIWRHHIIKYKYNGPLTQQQVVEQTPAYHILKDIYTIINGKYYPISTKEGYINGSFINYSSNINLHNHNINNVNEINANELSSKKICLNGVCKSNWSSASSLTSLKNNLNLHGNNITGIISIYPNGFSHDFKRKWIILGRIKNVYTLFSGDNGDLCAGTTDKSLYCYINNRWQYLGKLPGIAMGFGRFIGQPSSEDNLFIGNASKKYCSLLISNGSLDSWKIIYNDQGCFIYSFTYWKKFGFYPYVCIAVFKSGQTEAGSYVECYNGYRWLNLGKISVWIWALTSWKDELCILDALGNVKCYNGYSWHTLKVNSAADALTNWNNKLCVHLNGYEYIECYNGTSWEIIGKEKDLVPGLNPLTTWNNKLCAALRNGDIECYEYVTSKIPKLVIHGNLEVLGDLEAKGVKNSIVETKEGLRRLAAVEAPTVDFVDSGTSELHDGIAVVKINPVFLQTINTSIGYQVLLTALGNCSIYVSKLMKNGFIVRSVFGNQNCKFNWFLVAKRRGYERWYMEPAK